MNRPISAEGLCFYTAHTHTHTINIALDCWAKADISSLLMCVLLQARDPSPEKPSRSNPCTLIDPLLHAPRSCTSVTFPLSSEAASQDVESELSRQRSFFLAKRRASGPSLWVCLMFQWVNSTAYTYVYKLEGGGCTFSIKITEFYCPCRTSCHGNRCPVCSLQLDSSRLCPSYFKCNLVLSFTRVSWCNSTRSYMDNSLISWMCIYCSLELPFTPLTCEPS